MAKKREYDEAAESESVAAEPEAVAVVEDAVAAVAEIVKFPMAVHKQGESRLVRDDAEYERAKADGFTDEVGG